MLNFIMGLLLAPRLKKKGYHVIWEANLQPLGANLQPQKMLKVGPKFFLAPTPSVKRALFSSSWLSCNALQLACLLACCTCMYLITLLNVASLITRMT